MKRTHLAYLLSSLGIFVFGCQAAHDDAGSNASAATLSAVDDYLSSKAFAILPPDVASAAKASLMAAGNKGAHALVGLYSSQKFIALAASQDPASCTTNGTSATLYVIDWVEKQIAPKGSESADLADTRLANQVESVAYHLADPNVDVSKIDATLNAIGYAEFIAPTCGGSTGTDAGAPSNDAGAGNECDTTTAGCKNSGGGNEATTTSSRSMLILDGKEQAEQLGSAFAQVDSVQASPGMTREWNDLRARWNAGISHAARETLRTARLGGSATIGRDPQAAARFASATRIVDAMVRGQIAPTVDAMNLVHAAVASSDRGHMRGAGENVAMGKKGDYLDGAHVKTATDATFALAARMRANGTATPAIAAMLDQRLISIHPYMDANGRTTRLMTDWTLMRGGYPPALTSTAMRSSVILAGRGALTRDARLEHITEGMRRSVSLLDQLA